MPELSFLFLVAAITFVLTASLGYFGLRLLRRLRVGQSVRDEGPKTHYKKSGTPTFGGLFFLIPLFLFAILLGVLWPELKLFSLLVAAMFCFGLVGFFDDFIKVKRDKGGLKAKQKTWLMLFFAILFAYLYIQHVPGGPIFRLPFTGRALPIEGFLWKAVYGLFTTVYLYFTINATNLTDGLDGLLASVATASSLGLFALIWKLQADFLYSEALMYYTLALAAGMLGFFVWNKHPAKVFMGDTGSLAVGAGLSLTCLYLGMPWLFLFSGLIYCVEALSVILQVLYFKKTGGQRIFKMTPIHHHFELSGWSEWKVAGVFTLVTVLASVLSAFIV